MSKQARKHAIGMAGEFLVAGELLRREIKAAVTYGNAKKADVIAIDGNAAVSIEVKSTSEREWVLGNQLPVNDSKIWVLVYLPSDETASPEYFVLTGAELRALVLPKDKAYRKNYLEKHGKEFSGKGVVKIQRKLLDGGHLGNWGKVRAALGLTGTGELK